MLLADALSHLPSQTDTQIKLDFRVDAISISAFTRSHLTKIAAETQWDPILSTVHRLTLNGWPNRCTNIPRITRNYWDFCDQTLNWGWSTHERWMSHHPTILQRLFIMDDLHKSHAGINKALALARMCVYWPGMEADVTDYIKRCLTCIECSNLPIETLHPHQGPSRTLGQDRYGLLSRPSWKNINHCRLLQQVPICLPSGICTSFQDHQPSLRTFHSWRHTCHCDVCNNGPPFNGDKFKRFVREFDFMHTTSSPHFHQSIVSLRPWWRRSRMPTRKLMDLPMLKQEHYFSYKTHLSWQIFLLQLKYFMDDQHKEQSFQDPQNRSTYIRFGKNSLKYKTHRGHSLTEHTEQRIYECSKWTWTEYSSFSTKKGWVLLIWLTGTVTEILDCGHSYMI